MATLLSVFPMKSASGGISDAQNVTLSGSGGTGAISVGVRQIIAISVTGPVYIRFSLLSNSTATTSDFHIPGSGISSFDTGDEFDRVNFLNDNGATATVVSIARLSRS